MLTFGFAVVLVALALWLHAPRSPRETGLGWVSERWLADQRGDRSSRIV